MKVIQFALAVLATAFLAVGVVHLLGHSDVHQTDPPGSVPPPHAFIPAERATDEPIRCALADGVDIDELFSRPAVRCWLTDGWSGAREWGRWVKRPEARFEIHIDSPADRELLLRVKAPDDLPPDAEPTVELRVNGLDIARRSIRPGWKKHRVPVPGTILRSGTNRFELVFSYLVPATRREDGGVEISKAARVGVLDLVAPGAESDIGDDARSTDAWDSSRKVLSMNRAGTLVIPFAVPTGAVSMDIDLRATQSRTASDASLDLTIHGIGGAFTRSSTVRVPPGRSLTMLRLPIEELAGGWALASLEHQREQLTLEVSDPRFEIPAPISWASTDRRDRQQPPDIVWITLDAARADRFGFAGYHRDTSPYVDSIAQESLVFTNAYSLVPYTLCSVPTMLTGLSFLDHGVVEHEDVLSPDVTTLAEVLRDEGYLTAAFSATPNNSRAKNFDQGYEVFREMWTEGDRDVARRAPFIAARVVDWLETIETDQRPLHLQVHIIPPHEPYDPPPEHDHYTDPAYDGPCDGWPHTLFNVNNGVVEGSRECVDHVSALYDGNVNVADDAVRTIVEALRRRPQWKNTVLLVTSDHGEAFFEHQRLGHNATVYTEMLHVPFVLRMPDAFDPEGIDTEGLATLADIVPTLVAAAGIEPPSLIDGVDLLDPDTSRANRFFVGRNASRSPLFGLRSLRWSLMVSPSGSGGLFDLATDPGETVNLTARHAPVHIGLGKLLANRLSRPPELTATISAELDEKERELLETLGYIRN